MADSKVLQKRKTGSFIPGFLRMRAITNRSSAFFYGVGSLGNVSGGYDNIDEYMHGDYVLDMKADWILVGQCLRESMLSVKR